MLRTVDLVTGEVITEIEEPELVWLGYESSVAWSSDNRFFLYVEFNQSTLVFHDTTAGTTAMIPLTENVWEIHVT